MEQYGIVIKKEKDMAEVKIIKAPDCDKTCSECNLCSKKEVTHWADNRIGAKLDDTVKIEINASSFLSMIFFIYMLPVILVIAVYFAFDYFFGEEIADLSSVLTAFVSVVCVAFVGKKIFSKDKFVCRITEIMECKNK